MSKTLKALSGEGKTFEQWWPLYRAIIMRRTEYETARDAWLASYESSHAAAKRKRR